MFSNIGGKIKGLAKFVCGAGIVISIIYAILIWSSKNSYEDTTLSGIIALVLGCVISWVSSFFAYGFGELIEKVTEIERNTSALFNNTKEDHTNIIKAIDSLTAKMEQDIPTKEQRNKTKNNMPTNRKEEPSIIESEENESIDTRTQHAEAINTFLANIAEEKSFVKIKEAWDQTDLKSYYADVDKLITRYTNTEKLHGKLSTVDSVKERIASMLS